MSRWTHAACERCWAEHTRQQGQPDRVPVRSKLADVEPCCWCGFPTQSGIYVRKDPLLVPCGGFAHADG